MQSETQEEVQQGQFYNQLWIHRTFDVDLSNYFLWCAGLFIFFDPFHRCLVAAHKRQHHILGRFIKRNVAFFIFCMMSYSYSVFIFLLFHKAVGMQPRVRDLQRNEALIIGYLFVLTSLIIKAYIYLTFSVTTIMGGHYFKLENMPKKMGPVTADPYYHPLGTSSIICYFGFSVVRASAAGIILTIALGVAYCSASKLERYFQCRARKQELRQYTFTSITSVVNETEGKED